MQLRSPVYVIVNYSPADPLAAERLTDAALAGGAGILQLRAKEELGSTDYERLRGMLGRSRAHGVPFLINDRLDVAQALGADGVHVGLTDAPVAAAREALGLEAIVGATTPTPELAQAAQTDGASYVAVGSIYPSPTRPDKPVVGLERLRQVVEAVQVPVCAIGGITAGRVSEVLAAGAKLVCVISSVGGAADATLAVRELVEACHAE